MAAVPVCEKNLPAKKLSNTTYKTISLAKDKYVNITVISILMFSEGISI